MVAVRMGDGDKSDARRLKVELAKLGYQLLRARRMANWCVDRLVGDRIRIAGVPQYPLIAVLDEDACVGHLDRLADVNTRRPTRLILCRIVTAVHEINSIGRLCRGRRDDGEQYRGEN